MANISRKQLEDLYKELSADDPDISMADLSDVLKNRGHAVEELPGFVSPSGLAASHTKTELPGMNRNYGIGPGGFYNAPMAAGQITVDLLPAIGSLAGSMVGGRAGPRGRILGAGLGRGAGGIVQRGIYGLTGDTAPPPGLADQLLGQAIPGYKKLPQSMRDVIGGAGEQAAGEGLFQGVRYGTSKTGELVTGMLGKKYAPFKTAFDEWIQFTARGAEKIGKKLAVLEDEVATKLANSPVRLTRQRFFNDIWSPAMQRVMEKMNRLKVPSAMIDQIVGRRVGRQFVTQGYATQILTEPRNRVINMTRLRDLARAGPGVAKQYRKAEYFALDDAGKKAYWEAMVEKEIGDQARRELYRHVPDIKPTMTRMSHLENLRERVSKHLTSPSLKGLGHRNPGVVFGTLAGAVPGAENWTERRNRAVLGFLLGQLSSNPAAMRAIAETLKQTPRAASAAADLTGVNLE